MEKSERKESVCKEMEEKIGMRWEVEKKRGE